MQRLGSAEVAEISVAVEWMSADLGDIEKMLDNAGHGEEADYEHFFLTMGIHHMTEALGYLKEIVQRHDFQVEKFDTDHEVIETTGTVIRPALSKFEADRELAKKLAAEQEYEKLHEVLAEVLEIFPDAQARLDSGEEGFLGYLTGQVVKRYPKAKSATVAELITQELHEEE